MNMYMYKYDSSQAENGNVIIKISAITKLSCWVSSKCLNYSTMIYDHQTTPFMCRIC